MKFIHISSQTIKGPKGALFLLLLLFHTYGFRTEGRFPGQWRLPFLNDLVRDEDCFKGNCLQRHQEQGETVRARLDLLFPHQDYITDEDLVEKRDQQALSYTADSAPAAIGSYMYHMFHDHNPTPCSCVNRNNVHDLGLGVYPRFLYDVICNYSSCGSPRYRCHPLNHTTFVLKNKSDLEGMDLPGSDRLPESLRNVWRFEDVNITVACVCRKFYSHD